MKRVLILTWGLILFLLVSCQPAGDLPAPGAIETGIDPSAWVSIPKGEFLMGQHNHETEVDYDFEIMVTDVTQQQYAQFLNEALADATIQLENDAPAVYYPGDAFQGFNHEEEITEGWYVMIALDQTDARITWDGDVFAESAPFANHPVTYVTWFARAPTVNTMAGTCQPRSNGRRPPAVQQMTTPSPGVKV